MCSFLKQFRVFFVFAGLFSFTINMLLLTPSLYMLQVYDRVLASRSEETLLMLTIILGGAMFVMGALELIRSRLLVTANNAIDAMLAPFLLHKMISGNSSPEGAHYSSGLKDLHAIKTFLSGPGILALFDAPWLPVYLIILWLMHPLLFWIAIVGAGLMLGLTVMNEVATRQPMESANTAGRQAGSFVTAGLRNAEVVNAMGMQRGVISRWSSLNNRALQLQSLASNRAGKISGTTKFVRQFIQSIMLGAGAWLVIKSQGFTPGLMIAGTIILGKALAPIEHVIGSWKGLLEARNAYSRLDVFMSNLAKEPQHMELPPPTGQLSLEKVTFGIRTTNKIILKEISFSLTSGESLGIVGPSAAGKSSLARLITGVWKPTAGMVRMDGSDISSYDSGKLGRYIGYLPQDVELFAGTIADNIARMDTPDTERVIAASQLAGVHEMIQKMPDGYDTQIGEGGAALSGGQRQRIALARALFGSPKLVVLDEPNASLDESGEAALLQAFTQLKQSGVTVIVITHKLALLNNVDKLLVMQDGALALFGPRDVVITELMKHQQQQASQHPVYQQSQHPATAVAAVLVRQEGTHV